eukprot:5919563-Pleurochrysis_carterae.AAC.1
MLAQATQTPVAQLHCEAIPAWTFPAAGLMLDPVVIAASGWLLRVSAVHVLNFSKAWRLRVPYNIYEARVELAI